MEQPPSNKPPVACRAWFGTAVTIVNARAPVLTTMADSWLVFEPLSMPFTFSKCEMAVP